MRYETGAVLTNPADSGGAGPVSPDARIDSIDVLRGFALLGILYMNIQLFAMPDAAYLNPSAYGDLGGANFQVWLGGRLFADLKFMTIFAMLFGAGIVLMTTSAEARGGGSARVHYRRMGWLALIGLAHAHLLWAGDILFAYAVCGMVVWPLRRKAPEVLLAVGAVLIAVPSALYIWIGTSLPYWPEDVAAEITAGWHPGPELIDSQLAAYRGSWIEQAPLRSTTALIVQLMLLPLWFGWRNAGLMLVGMALFKLDVFSARRAPRFYGTLVAGALLVGIPATAYGVMLDFRHDWAADWSFFLGSQFIYWPSIAVSLGYIGGVMLVCRTGALRGLTRPFAAVGRTALSNYLLQTVICTTIFYGHGFGLYGSVDRVGQFGIVIGVWAVQMVASSLWLRHYRSGPAEWVWRAATYGSRPPFLRA